MRFSLVRSHILACAFENGKICIFDVSNGAKVHDIKAHNEECTAIAFSPVNHLLICSSGLDGKIQFYDTKEGKNVKCIDVQSPLSAISFCPDGHTIAVGTLKGKILIYDLKDAKVVKMHLFG